MTIDEILNMPAGRELDALIAKEIFGLDVKRDWHWQHTTNSYSTDISDAWRIVEKFDNHCLLNNVHGVWEVYLSNKECKSQSATLAICRAALLAKAAE